MAGKLQNEDHKSESELIALGATKTSLLNTTKIYTPKSADILENALRKNNYVATTDPTVNDDNTQGYEVGSKWVNTSTDEIFFLVDSATGAAVWSQGGGGGGSSALLKQAIEHSNVTVTDGAAEIEFNLGNISSSGDSLIDVQDDSANTRTKFVALVDCIIDVSASFGLVTSNRQAQIYKNGTVILTGSRTQIASSYSSVSGEVHLTAGDFITIGSNDTTISSPHYVQISAIAAAVASGMQSAIVFEQYGSAVNGGTPGTPGGWYTRALTGVEGLNPSIVSLSSNQFTLQPGKYLMRGWSTFNGVGYMRICLYNVTTGAYVSYGLNSNSDATANDANKRAFTHYEADLTVATTYELRYRTTAAPSGVGLGQSNGWSHGGDPREVERYTQINIMKVSS